MPGTGYSTTRGYIIENASPTFMLVLNEKLIYCMYINDFCNSIESISWSEMIKAKQSMR